MKATDMCGINFQGKFIEPKNISKKAYKAQSMLEEVLYKNFEGQSQSK